jgi:HSP20 family protein
MSTSPTALRNGSLIKPLFGDIFSERCDCAWPLSAWAEKQRTFPMDVTEYSDRYVISAELPGVTNEEIEMTLNNNKLSLQVKPQQQTADEEKKEVRHILRERRGGALQRTIVLPNAISEEHINAALKDGVLSITVQKSDALQPKKIRIQ